MNSVIFLKRGIGWQRYKFTLDTYIYEYKGDFDNAIKYYNQAT